MNAAGQSGADFELECEMALKRQGWEILDRQHSLPSGHRADMIARHPETDIVWFVECKGWGFRRSGKDTIKKALADAYDLAQLPDRMPFLLMLSHHMPGLLGAMVARAQLAGVVNEVLHLTPHR